MQNPFLLIIQVADFVMRPVLSIYISFVVFVVVSGLTSRYLARLFANATSLSWPGLFVNTFTATGAFAAALLAPRLLYHAPIWLR